MADEGMACPQCGNPNLDVDSANSVVFCRKCGFAVRVDPQSGEVTPLQQGGPSAAAPAVYRNHTLLGTEPFTFFLGATFILLLLFFLNIFDITVFGVLELLAALLWWMKK